MLTERRPFVEGGRSRDGQDVQIVARVSEGRLDDPEVDRRHLGGENGVLAAHLFGEEGARPERLGLVGPDGRGTALLHGGEERAQPDARGAEVGMLVDLDAGVDLARAREYLLDLVGGDRVETAAEGHELDEIEIVAAGDEGGRGVES